MIPKSGYRFSDEIMLSHRVFARFQRGEPKGNMGRYEHAFMEIIQ
jgi:hypothetical protein